MNFFQHSALALSLMGALVVMPAVAGSSAASSVSDSIATSVGSVSTSFGKSSDSSSKNKDTAQGDYTIVEMVAAADRPGTLRLKLQAVTDASTEGELVLFLPQQAVQQGRLAQGSVVTALPRAYGTEFARAETRTPFYLVLRDDWYRELASNAVTL